MCQVQHMTTPQAAQTRASASLYGHPMRPAPDRPAALASFLRNARERAGLSQEEVSEISGVARRTIAHWESGKADRPDVVNLRAVCLAVGASPQQAGVIIGLLDDGDDGVLDPGVAEVVAILQTELIDPEIKDEWISWLRWRVQQARQRRAGDTDRRADIG